VSDFDTDRFTVATVYDMNTQEFSCRVMCGNCEPGHVVAEWGATGPRLSTLTVTAHSHWERVHKGEVG
jgi:hypothetical protein